MRMSHLLLSSAAALSLLACSGGDKPNAAADVKVTPSQQVISDAPELAVPTGFETLLDNPLLAEFDGPYGGVPAFDKMNLDDLKPAIEWGMAKNLAEVELIANNPKAPTFENTILALEKAGTDLGRVFNYWGIWGSNLSSNEFRAIQREMSPKLSDFNSKITQNEALFARVKAVYDNPAKADMRPDQQRLIQITYDGFARNGATLDADGKARYAAINKRLAELHTKFGNNVLNDEEGYVTFLNEDQLSGLSDGFIKAMAQAAQDRGKPGQYAITNTRSSMSPFLTYSQERDLREVVWTNYYSRGDNGDEFDNNALISEIVKLRDERVGLLGYDNYAQWRLENRMAGTPEQALELMEAVWPAALARVEEEVADMQAIADAEGANITIAPWDYRFYAEKVRKAKYDLDSDEVKQYLQLDKLTDAMFYVAGELFNFSFAPVPEGSIPVFHEDVSVYEVTDKTSGEHIGLWYLDPFARPGKRSGAWATSYRAHTTYDGQTRPLSSNNSNFIKPAPGEAVLVSWDDATTFFHEFGHALHTLASNVAYPTLNGGVRDYTEFQSQLLERWLSTDVVVDKYLRHAETGAPMSADLRAKIKNAATFNQGFSTTEYLGSALVDMYYHTAEDTDAIDPDKFERETLAKLNMPSTIVMRHRSPHFGHIFSGEGYSAGYYGYMWADVLTSDASQAFRESPGGFYDKDVSAKLVKYLFAPRNAMDPGEAYRAFRGRDADISALMLDRGFPVPE